MLIYPPKVTRAAIVFVCENTVQVQLKEKFRVLLKLLFLYAANKGALLYASETEAYIEFFSFHRFSYSYADLVSANKLLSQYGMKRVYYFPMNSRMHETRILNLDLDIT